MEVGLSTKTFIPNLITPYSIYSSTNNIIYKFIQNINVSKYVILITSVNEFNSETLQVNNDTSY